MVLHQQNGQFLKWAKEDIEAHGAGEFSK